MRDKFPSIKLIAMIKMTNNRMFPLTLRNSNHLASCVHNVTILDESWLWNLRFSIFHFGGLNLLQPKQMVKGFPIIHEPTNSCERCILERKGYISS